MRRAHRLLARQSTSRQETTKTAAAMRSRAVAASQPAAASPRRPPRACWGALAGDPSVRVGISAASQSPPQRAAHRRPPRGRARRLERSREKWQPCAAWGRPHPDHAVPSKRRRKGSC
eukprot:scaffold208419_cov24-Tisochrysis_lutea.AAC.2